VDSSAISSDHAQKLKTTHASAHPSQSNETPTKAEAIRGEAIPLCIIIRDTITNNTNPEYIAVPYLEQNVTALGGQIEKTENLSLSYNHMSP